MTKLEKQLAEALIWATGEPHIADFGGYSKLVVPALNAYYTKNLQEQQKKVEKEIKNEGSH